MSREAIEKQGETFENYTRKKYFLWNYIFYIYVLERKDETDYTGLEYYIKGQYYLPDEEMEVKWIPNKGESEFDAGVEQSAQAHLIPGAFAPGDVAHGQPAAVDDGLVLR